MNKYHIIKIEELPKEIKDQPINADSFMQVLEYFDKTFPDHEYVETVFLPSKPSFFGRVPQGAFFILRHKHLIS